MNSIQSKNAVYPKLLDFYTKNKTLLGVMFFTVFTIASAQVAVMAQPVPFTLQTFAVILSGAMLGSRNGFLSQLSYLLLGVLGLPVFAGFTGGIHVVFGFTGGYLLAFPIASYLVGLATEKTNNIFLITLSMFGGIFVILLSGTSYLSLFFNGDIYKALFSGALIFGIWDILKVGAAISLYKVFKNRK